MIPLLQSKPGQSTRPEPIQAVVDAAKERAAKPKANEENELVSDDDEPALSLSMHQFRRLQKVCMPWANCLT